MAGPARPLRIIIRIIVIALLVFILFYTAFFWFTRRPFPKIRGRMELAGISASTEIFRDDDGVVHIWASNPEDLYFAQGWAQAQDRAWQMEFQRRVGSGRLAEVLGKSLIDTDRYFRTLGFAETAKKEYETMESPYKEWLEAYAAGVSAYFESRPPSRLGLEFAILRLTGTKWDIEPWAPVDSLVWGKMVCFSLSKNARHDARRMDLLRYIGRLKDDFWYAPYREDMPVAVTQSELTDFRRSLGIPDELPPYSESSASTGTDGGIGTNVWTIGQEHSADTGAVLVSDMHLGVQIPSIWHEIGLHMDSEDFHVRGYSFPGIPGVISGQNSHIAWGQSTLRGDVQDYVLETVDPDDPDLYLVDGAWERMEVSYETIKVDGRDEPVVHKVRRTRNGPVMTDLGSFAHLGSFSNDDEPQATELAWSWSALEPSRLLEAIFMFNRATNHREFRKAIETWDAPSINYVYADAEGNIAYQAAGRHPLRPPADGQYPIPLGSGGYDKRISVPFDQMPGSLNPEKGYVVSSNNAPVYAEYPYYIGAEYSPGFRARRISEMIENDSDGLDVADITAILMDTYSLQAEETWPFFEGLDIEEAHAEWIERRDAWSNEELSERELRKRRKQDEKDAEVLSEAFDILADWDFQVEAESSAAAIFAFVWKDLLAETYYDEIPDYSDFKRDDTGPLENGIYHLLRDPDNSWWDDDRTPQIVETSEDILSRTLVSGILKAAEEMGDEPMKWEWGEVHTVDFRNASLGNSGIGPIEAIFNRGPFPIRGGNSQVHKTNWKLDGGFETTTIQSQRSIYDLERPDQSLFINTCGQSGHPYHRHYDDMIKPYLDGEFHPSRFTREEVEKSAGGRKLTLIPAED